MIKLVKRVALFTTAALLVAGGIVGMLLPFLPGVILLLAGVAILHPEWAWPYRQLAKLRKQTRKSLMRVRAWIENRQARRGEKPEIQSAADETMSLYNKPKILVYEENVPDLARLAAPFESRDFEVCKCASLETAMRCIEQEEFDFALVDQGTLNFEGRRVIRHLIRYNFPIPFIVLAGSWDEQCRQQALELGAADYLEKPVTPAEFAWIINAYFNKQEVLEGRTIDHIQVAPPTGNAA